MLDWVIPFISIQYSPMIMYRSNLSRTNVIKPYIHAIYSRPEIFRSYLDHPLKAYRQFVLHCVIIQTTHCMCRGTCNSFLSPFAFFLIWKKSFLGMIFMVFEYNYETLSDELWTILTACIDCSIHVIYPCLQIKQTFRDFISISLVRLWNLIGPEEGSVQFLISVCL